jgi:hypothetical protein
MAGWKNEKKLLSKIHALNVGTLEKGGNIFVKVSKNLPNKS